MRSEQEMFDLILNIAYKDERIKAVYMNGSRTNTKVPKDIFQDYDIVYVVSETRPFYEDKTWIECFGERLYMQMPEYMDAIRGMECRLDQNYGWLIQLADGNRIDLHVQSIDYACTEIIKDKLCVILLDKDQILPPILTATDEDYYVKRPTENDFLCECNEFWWCLNNVAKGLWREEITYVMDMVNECVRPCLINLLAWKIGLTTDFSCSIGKSGKYMNRFLDEVTWQRFLETYSQAQIERMWQAVLNMCELFNEVAHEVASQLGYTYNTEEAKASLGYLKHVYGLPKEVKKIY